MAAGGLDDLLRHGFDEYGQFVNPLIGSRARMVGEPIEMLHAREGRLIDSAGREYEDFHGTQALGHRHPRVTQAVQEALASDAPTWFPSRVNPFGGRLAKRLCERSGLYTRVYFSMSGSDSVEAAIKLARASSRRPRVLGLQGGYHGCTLGSLALMEPGPFRDPFGPHLPGAELLPPGDTAALERALAPGDVACVVVEPIQMEGGVRPLSPEYVLALGELTKRHGALLVADEVQTGCGRTGRFLSSAEWPRRPDAVCLAKHLGGGLLPVSAMLTTAAIFQQAYGRDFEDGESHNTTFGNNGLGAVAALATLEVLSDELIAQVREKGARFRAMLTTALRGNPLFVEVRGEGLMVGVELRDSGHPWLSWEHFGFPGIERPALAAILCQRLFKHGFYCFVCGHQWGVLRLQPRFEIPEETLARFVEACAGELGKLAEVA